MCEKPITTKNTLSEIKAARARGEDQTRSDAPEAESLGEDFWKDAQVVMPRGKLPCICASIATLSNGSKHAAKAI